MMTDLQSDPLYLDFIGVLAIGAIITMLLALIGNLVASWLSTRGRLTNFVVFAERWLAPSQQVASILTWEQCMTYVTKIILGTIGGILFSKCGIPTSSIQDLLVLQNSDTFQRTILPRPRAFLPCTLFIPSSLSLTRRASSHLYL